MTFLKNVKQNLRRTEAKSRSKKPGAVVSRHAVERVTKISAGMENTYKAMRPVFETRIYTC